LPQPRARRVVHVRTVRSYRTSSVVLNRAMFRTLRRLASDSNDPSVPRQLATLILIHIQQARKSA
jgi:hypothetical protein